ncbi:lytic transglycosylase domain-containing protein [Candidatus Woesearchaeota archaeon]|nr:lytic transglycosylase domain-containing protein [Candidatus Woesearchaeota archaeon]
MVKRLGTALGLVSMLAGCSVAPPPVVEPVEQVVVQKEEDLTPVYEMVELAEKKALASMNPEFSESSDALRQQSYDLFTDANILCKELNTCNPMIITDSFNQVLEQQTARNQELIIEPEEEEIFFGEPSPDIPTIRKGDSFSILSEMNGPVKEAVRHWLVKNRTAFLESYVNFLFLEDIIEASYDPAGFPIQLGFGIGSQESNFKLQARSYKGATGMWQFMYQTGIKYGIRGDLRYHPELSTKANVRYLEDAVERFDDDLLRVIASYNTGIDRNALQGKEDYWQIEHKLYAETRTYVRRILAAIELFDDIRSNEKFYNITLPEINPSLTSVKLEKDLSLGEVQACLGNPPWMGSWLQVLRNTNSSYGMQPFDYIPSGTDINIPTMTLEAYDQNCRDSEFLDFLLEARPKFKKHHIKRGHSYGYVASLYSNECGMSQTNMVRAIRDANPWKPSSVPVGKTMIVPCKQ